MNELDPRIITVTIEVNGQTKTYSSPLAITANGTKYGNALQNECVVTIDNLGNMAGINAQTMSEADISVAYVTNGFVFLQKPSAPRHSL